MRVNAYPHNGGTKYVLDGAVWVEQQPSQVEYGWETTTSAWEALCKQRDIRQAYLINDTWLPIRKWEHRYKPTNARIFVHIAGGQTSIYYGKDLSRCRVDPSETVLKRVLKLSYQMWMTAQVYGSTFILFIARRSQ